MCVRYFAQLCLLNAWMHLSHWIEFLGTLSSLLGRLNLEEIQDKWLAEVPSTISKWTLPALQVPVTESWLTQHFSSLPQPKPLQPVSFASLSPASLSYVTQPVWSYTHLFIFGFCWSLFVCFSWFSPLPSPLSCSSFFYSSLTLPLPLSSQWSCLLCWPCPVWTRPDASGCVFPIPTRKTFSTTPRSSHVLLFIQQAPGIGCEKVFPLILKCTANPWYGSVALSFIWQLFLLSLSSIFFMLGGFSALALTEFLTSLMGLVISPITFPVPEEQGDRGSRALVVWHWMVFSTFTVGRILHPLSFSSYLLGWGLLLLEEREGLKAES